MGILDTVLSKPKVTHSRLSSVSFVRTIPFERDVRVSQLWCQPLYSHQIWVLRITFCDSHQRHTSPQKSGRKPTSKRGYVEKLTLHGCEGAPDWQSPPKQTAYKSGSQSYSVAPKVRKKLRPKRSSDILFSDTKNFRISMVVIIIGSFSGKQVYQSNIWRALFVPGSKRKVTELGTSCGPALKK